MFSDFQKAQEALTLIALARFTLDIANSMKAPTPWNVTSRQALQQQARDLLARVRAARK